MAKGNGLISTSITLKSLITIISLCWQLDGSVQSVSVTNCCKVINSQNSQDFLAYPVHADMLIAIFCTHSSSELQLFFYVLLRVRDYAV